MRQAEGVKMEILKVAYKKRPLKNPGHNNVAWESVYDMDPFATRLYSANVCLNCEKIMEGMPVGPVLVKLHTFMGEDLLACPLCHATSPCSP